MSTALIVLAFVLACLGGNIELKGRDIPGWGGPVMALGHMATIVAVAWAAAWVYVQP